MKYLYRFFEDIDDFCEQHENIDEDERCDLIERFNVEGSFIQVTKLGETIEEVGFLK